MSDMPVALVTGASRGIGRAIAVAIAGMGYRVVCCGRDLSALQDTVDSIGSSAVPCELNVADETSCRVAVGMVMATWGRLDVLVNNAGIGTYGPLSDYSLEDLDRILSTNVRGAFCLAREVLGPMEQQRSGYIINIGSVVSYRGYPEQAAYAASKHALLGLTKSLAAEVDDKGIRVSIVSPGGVATELATRSRPDLDTSTLMSAEDVAGAVTYLLGLSPRVAVDEVRLRRRGAAPFL